MSVAGEQRISIDETQNGFTSDAYSCAVSFCERYGLRVMTVFGVCLPEIPVLEGESRFFALL